MVSTSASWMAKPGPLAPNSGITLRMMVATAASSLDSMGRRFHSELMWRTVPQPSGDGQGLMARRVSSSQRYARPPGGKGEETPCGVDSRAASPYTRLGTFQESWHMANKVKAVLI